MSEYTNIDCPQCGFAGAREETHSVQEAYRAGAASRDDVIADLRNRLHDEQQSVRNLEANIEALKQHIAAIAAEGKVCTNDEWLANCPQSVRDLANKIKKEPT